MAISLRSSGRPVQGVLPLDLGVSAEPLKTEYALVSMFSGCGGMDLGFVGGFTVFGRYYRSLPFRVVWANELNAAACRTYRRNLGAEIICGDVWRVMDTMPGRADVLIGGFPCQDVSVNGKRVGINGKRTGLYRAMLEGIRRTHPRVFVAENVKGLLMKHHHRAIHQVVEDFEALGYTVTYRLYLAAHYGVPQTRERVFIVGTSADCKPFAAPPRPRQKALTAKQAISDLEKLGECPAINHVWSSCEQECWAGKQ